jgi:hypothetical protein
MSAALVRPIAGTLSIISASSAMLGVARIVAETAASILTSSMAIVFKIRAGAGKGAERER